MPETPSSPRDARQEAMTLFQQFLDAEERRRSEGADSQAAQEAYWARARAALFINADSSGLKSIDAVMEAVLNGGDAAEARDGPVLLLPPPSRQREAHSFAEIAPRQGTKRPLEAAPAGSDSPATNRPKHDSKKKKAESSSPKDSKPSPVKGSTPPSLSPASDLATFGFELAEGTAPEIRQDLWRVFQAAAAKDKSPFMIAYPWSSVRLYLAHWRFWNAYRSIFWRCAIHPPVASGAPQTYYRKQKMKACQARLRFLSLCIETWGYIEFLKLLDEGSTRLSWLGGCPGRHSPKSTKGKGNLDLDLAALYAKDHTRYSRRIPVALNPSKIDEDGYSSVTELLEHTGALDPDTAEASRLSDRALARVRSDMEAKKVFRRAWAPKSMKSMFKRLYYHDRIKSITIPDTLHEPNVPPLDSKDLKIPGFSSFKRKDGSFAALAPLAGGVVTFPESAAEPASAASNNKAEPTVITLCDSDDSQDEDDDEDAEESSDTDETSGKGEDDDGRASEGEDSAQEDEGEENPPAPPQTSTKPKPRMPKTRSASKSA